MLTYHNVTTQLIGEDRADALSVIDDDLAFDLWMKDFERKRARMEAGVSGGSSGRKPAPRGRVSVSKDDFLEKLGAVKGGN